MVLFSGATTAGTDVVSITYTPPVGPSITIVYTVTVETLSFAPLSADYIVGDPDITIFGAGSPPGGTFSTSVSLPFTDSVTGGTFDALDPSAGTFTFGGATSGGAALIPITLHFSFWQYPN